MFVWIFVRGNTSYSKVITEVYPGKILTSLNYHIHCWRFARRLSHSFIGKFSIQILHTLKLKTVIWIISFHFSMLSIHTAFKRTITEKEICLEIKWYSPILQKDSPPKCCTDQWCLSKYVSNDSSRNQMQNKSEHYLNYTIDCRIRNFLTRC